MARSVGLDRVLAAGPPIGDEPEKRPSGAVWRICLTAGVLLLYGFATPVRLGLSRALVWAHDWLAQQSDPRHRAHHLIVHTRQGGGDWGQGARTIAMAFAGILVLVAVWQLGRRKAVLGRNPFAAFFIPSRRTAIIIAAFAVVPAVLVAVLMHWQPAAAEQVLRVLTKVTDSLATHTGRDGW